MSLPTPRQPLDVVTVLDQAAAAAPTTEAQGFLHGLAAWFDARPTLAWIASHDVATGHLQCGGR